MSNITSEQLLELLKQKLSIRVEVSNGGYYGRRDEVHVSVKILFDEETVAEDSSSVIVSNE